jgi:hypothetical protein
MFVVCRCRGSACGPKRHRGFHPGFLFRIGRLIHPDMMYRWKVSEIFSKFFIDSSEFVAGEFYYIIIM